MTTEIPHVTDKNIDDGIALLSLLLVAETACHSLEIGPRASTMELAAAIGETIHRARELAIVNQSALERLHACQSNAGDAYNANR